MITNTSTFYSGGGIVTTDIGLNSSDWVTGLILLSDGKIMVYGRTDNDFALTRYNSDGSFDASFGNSGIVTTDFGLNSSAWVTGLTLLSDGKIMVYGETDVGSDIDFALARYNSDGSLDATFGNNGKVTTDINLHSVDYLDTVSLQSDGNILVAGSSRNTGGFNSAMVRYNSDGSLDTSFSYDGKVTPNIDWIGITEGNCLTVLQNGQILLAGDSDEIGFYYPDFTLLRYNSNGSLDSTFGSAGKVTTDIGLHSYDSMTSMTLQSDGKILAAGVIKQHLGTNSDWDFALVRYNSNGSLDSSFGSGGKVITDIGLHSDDYMGSMTLQNDGKILSAGYTDNSFDSDLALVRYNSDGCLDASFGNGGIVTTNIGLHDEADSMTLQSDGKILIVGYQRVDGCDSNFFLIRYNSDGSIDTSFGSAGTVTLNSDFHPHLTLQNDGKILVAENNNNDFILVRYNSDGTLDTSPLMTCMIHNGVNIDPDRYSGPAKAAGEDTIHFQFIGDITGELLVGTAYNDFTNVGAGDDAVNAGAGNDVIDGGLGSNFLTGGAGTDIFFSDGRGGGITWSTITDWQTGEQLSVWGWKPGVSKILLWQQDGAEGYKGLTMHADLNGDGVIDTSVTFTGIASQSQLPTPLDQFDNLLWFK
jgi:uncharacterized delta-60 repeat protein